MATPTLTEPAWTAAITSSVAALKRMSGYTLPDALDERILSLGERKESLTEGERAELLAWVMFTQQRSAEKLEAELALRRLATVCPELATVS